MMLDEKDEITSAHHVYCSSFIQRPATHSSSSSFHQPMDEPCISGNPRSDTYNYLIHVSSSQEKKEVGISIRRMEMRKRDGGSELSDWHLPFIRNLNQMRWEDVHKIIWASCWLSWSTTKNKKRKWNPKREKDQKRRSGWLVITTEVNFRTDQKVRHHLLFMTWGLTIIF